MAGSSQVAAPGPGRAGGHGGASAAAGSARALRCPAPCPGSPPLGARQRPRPGPAGLGRGWAGLGWGLGRPAGRSRAPEGVWSRCGRAARALRDPPVAGLRGALGSAPGRPARGLSAGAPRCWGLSAFPVTRRGCQGASRRWETSPSFTF